jgi:hypothetical protein
MAIAGALLIYISNRPVDKLPYEVSLSGNAQTPWIEVRTGIYDIAARQDSRSCVGFPITFSRNGGDPTVNLRAVALGFGGGPVHGQTDWFGQTRQLPIGEYRFTGAEGGVCEWSARLSQSSA